MAKRFGLDVDGVLYNYDKTVRYMLRTMRNQSENPALQKEATSWTSTQEAVSKHDWDWVWSKGVKLGLFRYGHLYTGAIEGIRGLARFGDVVVITHRPENAVQDTLDWLAYLRLPFKEVFLLTKGEPKSSVPHCDLYLDDKPENVIDYNDHTSARAVLLWDRPWNRDWDTEACGQKPKSELLSRIGRVWDWEDVLLWAKNLL